MKSLKNCFLVFSLLALVTVSCSKDEDDNIVIIVDPEAYENGIFVTNEGPFGNGTGTVTFISSDLETVEQEIYQKVNGGELGNIVNGMGFSADNAYIVANNSNRVTVVDRNNFERKATITSGLENPRHFVSTESGLGYVSNWGDPMDEEDDYIAVVDLSSNTITSTIPVTFGPEKMLVHDNKIFVAHQGGYGYHHVVSVISGNEVVNTITVGDTPNSMVKIGNYLYVLGSGKPDYSGDETAGSLSKIDLTSQTVVERVDFEMTEHPSNLTSDGTYLYYNLDGKVYKLSANTISSNPTAIIDGFFYTMEVKGQRLFATDAGDFASQGKLFVYDLSTFEILKEISTGIIPGGIYFNE